MTRRVETETKECHDYSVVCCLVSSSDCSAAMSLDRPISKLKSANRPSRVCTRSQLGFIFSTAYVLNANAHRTIMHASPVNIANHAHLASSHICRYQSDDARLSNYAARDSGKFSREIKILILTVNYP
jgi:hypothetical protein